jgi:hypothetical protein
MKSSGMARGALWLVGNLILSAGLCGCQHANGENKTSQTVTAPAKTEPAPADPAKTEPAEDETAPKPRDLGPPLVDNVKALKKLDPVQPVWIDPQQKQVVLTGETCKASYPLEFLVTTPGREYEAVLVVRVKPSVVHAGLLAVGAKPGSPAKFQPKYAPPTGTEVAIEIRWKDKAGKLHKVPAQQFVRNIKTKKPLDVNWVFAGSGWHKDEETGREYYMGDGGDFITVLNLPTAVLDVPVKGAGAIEDRSFEGFVENIPPEGTPVTIVLKPKVEAKGQKKAEASREAK